MSNKRKKSKQDEKDYEIVSFQDICDKSPLSKNEVLSENDNINYRLCFEKDNCINLLEAVECNDNEASLSDKSVEFDRKAATKFAPFGRHNPKPKASLFKNVLPKVRPNDENRYQRFSTISFFDYLYENMTGVWSTLILVTTVVFLSVGVWWLVCVALGGGWGEEHYRKLWLRAHPHAQDGTCSETHYHDHNNLSTKNKMMKTFKSYNYASNGSCLDHYNSVHLRIDCNSQDGRDACFNRGCCWNTTDKAPNAPSCYFPSEYPTYRFYNMSETSRGVTVYYMKNMPSGYPGDFGMARLDFKYQSDEVLQIKISDPENNRFESPYPEIPIPEKITNKKYKVVVQDSSFGFQVIRTSDDKVLMDTTKYPIILANNFLQLTTKLSSNILYGLGERQTDLPIVIDDFYTTTLFNADRAPYKDLNLYGTHPFYMSRDNSTMHGVVLINTNAMDIITQPIPALTYRTTGGIFNLFVMTGPSPKDVLRQYHTLIGPPPMPPYWALGFHLCKFNYGSLNETKDVMQKNIDAGIPIDVQWSDIDYMENYKDFTYDEVRYAGLPEFVDELHKSGRHYVISIDPGISAVEKPGTYPAFDRGLEMDVFVKNSTSQLFIGKVWNYNWTAYTDFTHPNVTAYWTEMLMSYHKRVPFDGTWLDMNEPANFVAGALVGQCEPEKYPYKPIGLGDDGFKTKTLCMDAKHYEGSHFDWHNLYAYGEAVATYSAMQEIRSRRPFLITRSTFVGSGKYTGHWSGDINSDWNDFAITVPKILNFALFGIPMMGADICGFRSNTTVELCKRWMQLGAFYPFSRNHNSDTSIPQDPVSLGPDVIEASRVALRLRYTLIPYYYTMFWKAHTDYETVARPLFLEYPNDNNTYLIGKQFMIGPSIMIAPILTEGESTTHAYLPGKLPWISLQEENYYKPGWTKIPENNTVLFRPGRILVKQELPPEEVRLTTTVGREMPFHLIAMQEDGQAEGDMYWDDGDSLTSIEDKKYSYISFKIQNNTLRNKVRWYGYAMPVLGNITMYNIKKIDELHLNDKPQPYNYDNKKQILRVSNLNVKMNQKFVLSWSKK